MNYSFYSAVLPPDGHYCVVGISGNAVHPSFHDSLADLIAKGDALRQQKFDAYFALANFNTVEGGRKADNAKALRCFFVDIDCGAGKPYEDQSAGAVALRSFIQATKLPEPFVVNSGRGLHAYWPFHEVLNVATWRPLARRFKQLCVEQHLRIDLAVTADVARVLRMVDTENYKQDPPLPVQLMSEGVVSDLATLASLLPVSAEVDLSAAREYGADDMTRALAGGDFPPTEFARIVRRSVKGKGCAQIANAVTNAATLEEPLWRAALSIAWRCTDAETAIHTLSRAHPEYSPDNTIRKAESTLGPMTCEWYKSNYGTLCTGCTQRCTSPIAIGRKMEEAQVVDNAYMVEQQLEADNSNASTPQTVQVSIPAYPFPYFRGIHGGVYVKSKDADGDPIEVEIYKHDLYLTSRFYDINEQGEGDGEMVGVNLHTPHDGIRRIVAPVATLLTKEKMRDTLLKHGVIAINKDLDGIMAYFASSIRNLQKMFASDRTRSQMGWTPDNSGFVVGELEYTANGARLAPAASGTKLMAPMMIPKGSLTEWTKMVNFYDRPGMEAHALAVFFGFGAPLLRLIGGVTVRGAAINLMSNKSGTGKTTAQMVVNSIFGHPSELLMKKSDTTMSKVQWMGMLNSIAATMDEVTNLEDEELSELVYDIPQGRGKHRMEASSNKLRANVISWATFVIMSSNSSLYDKLRRLKSTSDGELRRLIELRITRPVEVSKQESDQVFGALEENYGVAGPVYMQHVLKTIPEVEVLARKIQRKLDADLALDQSDRFYSIVLACAFAGGTIAARLGLHSINVQRVYQYALTTMNTIRRDVVQPASNTELAAQETLTTYINENMNNTLVINGIKNNGIAHAPIKMPHGPLRLRYEPDTRELWIPASALRDVFVSRQVDFQNAIKELTGAKILKHSGAAVTKRIGAGAVGSFESMGVRCYCIDGTVVGIDNDAFTTNGAAST